VFRVPFQAARVAVAGSLLVVAAGLAYADKEKPKTASTAPVIEEIAIGAKAPDFNLQGTDGKQHSLSATLAGDGQAPKATVVVFTCNHCPFSKAYEPVLIEMANKYPSKDVAWVLINSNDPALSPEDSFEKMQEIAKAKNYPFPYVFDSTQQTAQAYGASRTPHVFLVDAKGTIVYRGRINDNKDKTLVKTNDLADAIDATIAGKEVANNSTKAIGCTIKWKKAS
jgi:peroxiredoxin